MPLMGGFQFLEAYQSLDFKNKDSVVVAVLTSSFNPKDVNRAKEFSVDDFIVKPLTKEKMMELMEQHFGGHTHSVRLNLLGLLWLYINIKGKVIFCIKNKRITFIVC